MGQQEVDDAERAAHSVPSAWRKRSRRVADRSGNQPGRDGRSRPPETGPAANGPLGPRLSLKQEWSIAQSVGKINLWTGVVRSGKTTSSLLRVADLRGKRPRLADH